MSEYGMSRDQIRRLRHASISQTERILHGVQGEPGYPSRTPMPGFNPDAEPLTEEWHREKEEYWAERRRKAREETDE